MVFPLFGVPFALVGLGLMLSPVWLRRKLKRTGYALTNRRALLIEGGLFGSRLVKSYAPEDLSDLERVERANGSGDLVFERVATRVQSDDGRRVRTAPRGFLAIPDVRDVERLLRETLGV